MAKPRKYGHRFYERSAFGGLRECFTIRPTLKRNGRYQKALDMGYVLVYFPDSDASMFVHRKHLIAAYDSRSVKHTRAANIA